MEQSGDTSEPMRGFGGANLSRRERASTGTTAIKGEENYYEAPTMERSPEVFQVLQAMDQSGVNVFVDVKDDSIATCSNQIATRFDLSRSDVGTSNPLRIACPIPIRHGVGIQHAPNCWVPPCWMLYSTCTHYFSEADADSDFWTKLPPTRCLRDSHKQV
jgi:hypothetical protein